MVYSFLPENRQSGQGTVVVGTIDFKDANNRPCRVKLTKDFCKYVSFARGAQRQTNISAAG